MGDATLDDVLPDVEVDLARCSTHVAEVSVSHLSGSIHDATHHGNGDTCCPGESVRGDGSRTPLRDVGGCGEEGGDGGEEYMHIL